MPPELKTEKSLERFKDVSEVAKSWIEAQKVISKKGIIPPGDKATPEEIASFHKALGAPDSPDGYELKAPELPEGMVYDENRTKAFAEIAHREGVSKKQLAAMHEGWNEMAKAEHEAQIKAVKDYTEQSTVAMKKEWGKDYETNKAQADAAIEKVFGSEFKKFLIDTGLCNHPDVVKGVFKASQMVGEHALASRGTTYKGKSTMTWEKLVSMKMDPRYSDAGKKDPAYIKEVEQANREYAESLGAQER